MTSSDKLFCTVQDGYRMAYMHQDGNDGPIVFLHGNPTSSYLWRNILPQVSAASGRMAIAPDLIGMGDSDKLSNSGTESYRFPEHAAFLDTFMEECVLDGKHKVILVIHDWGSGLGFHWARRNPELVQGIVYMEAMTKPFNYSHFDPLTTEFMRGLRTPGIGEQLVLENNTFIEQGLPAGILRNLTDEELAAYRAPYLEAGESRRPTLSWPREIPLDGTIESPGNRAAFEAYAEWMAENNLPKLFINAEPGLLLVGELREFARTWKNQTEVTVTGLHFIQEDAPDEIVDAINDWMTANNLVAPELIDGSGGAQPTSAPRITSQPTAPPSSAHMPFHGGGIMNSFALLLCVCHMFVRAK